MTLGTQGASATSADASSIQQTERAIALRPSFLWVERMIGATEQGSIELKGKSRSWKATSKRSACPLRRAIPHSRNRLGGGNRLGLQSRGEFACAHGRGREVLSAFQAKIPQPLREDLPELLSASGMRTPAVRVLLGVFVGKNGFKGPSMQIQVQHIFRAARGEWQSGDKQFVDHSLAL